jgi:CCR4-NOT transcription complex subunit 6
MIGFIASTALRPFRIPNSVLRWPGTARGRMAAEFSRRKGRMRAATPGPVQLGMSHDSGPRRVERIWEETTPSPGIDRTSVAEIPTVVTILSYNVLAQTYVSKRIFPDSSHSVLRAKRRTIALIDELRMYVEEYKIDVLCLQELEQDMCTAILRELNDHGSFAYKLRTSAGTSHKRDGSCIFWRRSRFECVHDRERWHLELNDVADDIRMSPLFESSAVAKRDCISAMVCLSECRTGNRFVISSSHLFWDPSFPLVKLAQAFRVREAAFELAEAYATKNLVLAGDWNSVPNSSIFAFLGNGRISGSYVDCSSSEEAQMRAVNIGTAEKLQSVHRFGGDTSDIVSATEGDVDEGLSTYTSKFRGALDHIFLSAGHRGENSVLGTLSLPTKRDFTCKDIRALPSEGHPSDHIPIVARLSLASDAGSFTINTMLPVSSVNTGENEPANAAALGERLQDLCNII